MAPPRRTGPAVLASAGAVRLLMGAVAMARGGQGRNGTPGSGIHEGVGPIEPLPAAQRTNTNQKF
jgi:hypothetical protein